MKPVSNIILKFSLVLCLIFASDESRSYPGESLGHFIVGFGEGYGVSTVRGGGATWEFGMLNSETFGLTKLIYKENFYYTIGIPVNRNISTGIFGGVGGDYKFLSIFTLRWEINAGAFLDNFSHAEAIIGVSLTI